jgi:hypothetical protein
MTEYFRLTGSRSHWLMGWDTVEDGFEETLCPATEGMGQHRTLRRKGNLALEVRHTRHDQLIVSTLMSGMVFHARLLEEFERRGFTGYRLRPATVRFRDGYLSQEYSELIVTGWAGVASPESGIELLESCGACGHKNYSPLKHPERLIDWAQWSGEDFFMVWPMPKYIMITKRVAEALTGLKVSGIELLENGGHRVPDDYGYSVGALSEYLPAELADKYGRPLRLECDAGAWPVLEPAVKEDPEAAMAEFFAMLQDMPSCGTDTCEDAPEDAEKREADRQAAMAALAGCAEGDAKSRSEAMHQCLGLLESGTLRPADLAPHTLMLLGIWHSLHAELKPRQQDAQSFEWMLNDDYSTARALAEVLLDILGYVPGDDVAMALHEGMSLIDPRLKTFAIVSQLRRGGSVDPEHMEQAASSLEMRETLWGQLKRIGRESMMPARWAKPEVLAASDLCRWAAHPNELGFPPEEVQFAGGVRVEGTEDMVYLFRFREYPKPWEPGEGWMAGIAGTADSPWSSFKKWDSMTPQEHFDKLYYR